MSLHAAAVGPSVLPDLREQVEQIIAEARRQGASACEVAVSLEQGLSTSVRQGEVETVEFNRDQGFGITLYAGQRKGSASTSATGEAAIRETVAAALAIARHTSEDECAGLADAALMARELPELDLYHPWSLSPEQAVERALACEAAAFAADKRVTKADGTTLNTHQGCRVYGNSHGFIGGYASTRHSLSCVMIAEGAVEARHAGQRQALAGHVEDDLAAEAVADRGDLAGIGLRLPLQQFQAGEEARLGGVGIPGRGLHEGHRVLRVLGVLAFAVHVDGQGAVAEFGEVAGAALGVVVEPPPFVDHDDPRADPRLAVVVGEIADHARAVGAPVRHLAGLDSGLGAGGAGDEQQGAEQAHGISP